MVEMALRDRKPLVTFVASLLLLLMLMSYQVTDSATGRTVLGNVLFQAFSPIQSAVMWVVHGMVDTFHGYVNLVDAERENQQLQREITELRIRISASEQELKENERLRSMLELEQRVPYTLLAGEVIGRDARSVSATLTINRGRRDGVRRDMAALTPAGAVGKTIQVGPLTSRVQLITDADSAIGAMLDRTQIAGILAGAGRANCVLRYLPLISDVKPGDIVVTSGQDGIFPQGTPVGTVVRILSESDLFKSAEVVPYQEFSSMREIMFLLQTTTPNPLQSER